jgi:DNA-binding NarL/FixJ family response regulator
MNSSALQLNGIMTEEHLQIYFVEDNPTLSFWLKKQLENMSGVETVGSANSGHMAIDEVTKIKPDLALVDIGLPDISGIEVTRALKKALPQLPVIILTASEDEKDIFGALDAGADGYVLKSQSAYGLQAAIKSIRLGSVWLDPVIAEFVLANNDRQLKHSRTGRHTLTNVEISRLGEVAASNCHDGVCLVEPDFISKLKRLQTD